MRNTTEKDDQPDLKFCAIFYESKYTINSGYELLELMISLMRESIQRVFLIRSYEKNYGSSVEKVCSA